METAIHGYNRAERSLSNKILRKTYGKIKVDASTSTEKKTKEKKNQKYTSRRSLFPPLDNSKFNLTPLLKHQGPIKLHPLYEPLANLLRQHYEKQVFKKEVQAEKIEYKLIDELIKKAQKFPEAESLSELYPDDPSLKKLFYKMLKGTNNYSSARGITPLRSLLTLSKQEKAISPCFASPSLLEALFGEEIAAEILKLECSKWEESKNKYIASKEDIQNIIIKFPEKVALFTVLDPFLDYSKQLSPRDILGARDDITGIAVELRLK